ncbi:MAG: ABC transporter ATP-binding protein [Phycisphaerales bacterium]|nr:ABC transporter ATP-binding protein [Planctomycetota bacterium]MCH8509651.1 ABC transporter ATP-binding protein [Phycisphaerales bacterium]
MLACENIAVIYPARGGGRTALNGVSCTLAPGRITVFVGPNGAGKSTLLRVLAGVRPPDRGSVTLDAVPLAELSVRRRASRVALVAQQPSVAFDFDARRVIAFGAEGAGHPSAAVDRAIERFRLAGLASTPFGALSVGQRQRVSLARAWAQLDGSPGTCLLADEPVSAMDPAHAVRAFAAFRDLADRGAALGLVLHDLSAAARLADHAVLLGARGTIIAAGEADEVLTSDLLSDLFETPIHKTEHPGLGPVLATDAPRRAV